MTRQDRDVIVVSVVSGITLLSCLTGTAWGLLGLARLVHPKKETA